VPAPSGLPWNLPPSPRHTVGWVFRADPDEPIRAWLRPGAEHEWKDARAVGKERDQPVLFLQSGPTGAHWAGWGYVLGSEDRWRTFGVRTVAIGAFRPGLPAAGVASPEPPARPNEMEWENRALAEAAGLLVYREHTPFIDVGATDLRLTASDLQHLARAQPRLRELIPPVPS
jgi:hypothetical protein